MQHHARPAGTEHNVELAGGGGGRFEIVQRWAPRVIDTPFPGAALDEPLIALAPAITVAAAFLAVAVTGDDRDGHPHQRTDIAIGLTVRAQNLPPLPARAE